MSLPLAGCLSLPQPMTRPAIAMSFRSTECTLGGDKGEEGVYVFSMELQDARPELLPNRKTQHIAENVSYMKTFVAVEHLQEKAITL